MIVVGIDGSDVSRRALRLALDEAALRGTRVRAVHAWSAAWPVPLTGAGFVPPVDPEPLRLAAETVLRETVEAVAGERGASLEQALVERTPGEGILESATDAELIVVGHSRHGALGALVLGSVSEHVLRHARCPVLVVPHAPD